MCFFSGGSLKASGFTGLYSFLVDPGVPPGVHIPGTSFREGDSRPAGDFLGVGGECCIPGDQIPGKSIIT